MHSRRSDIQGLRAVAVLSVILAHSGLAARGGFVGVDVFFAISGYVITGVLRRELADTGRISLPSFYLRRVRRLIPALAATVIVVELLGLLLTPADSTHVAGLTGLFALLFSANIYLAHLPHGYFDASTRLDPLLHTWTLAVEEQFYLVFPVTLALVWRFAARRRLAPLVVGCLGVASFLLTTHGHPLSAFGAGARSASDYYGASSRAWEFALGALIALTAWRVPRVAASAVSAAALALLAAVVLASTEGDALLDVSIIPVVATCALLVSGRTENLVSEALSLRPLTWIGDLSYSLYLWHWPLIVFARASFPDSGWAAPTAAALSIVPAWLSWRFVESPFRSTFQLPPMKVIRVAAVGVALAAAASAIELRWPLVVPDVYAAQLHVDRRVGCDDQRPLGAPERPACTWGSGSRGTVTLVGDSNAGQYAEAVIAAGRQTGFAVTVATASACPFAPLKAVTAYDPAGTRQRGCVEFYRGTVRALLATTPSLVVIGARVDRYLASYGLERLGSTRPVTTSKAKSDLWTAALRSVLSQLTRRGIPVMVLQPLPVMPTDVGSCASLLLLEDRCKGRIARSLADRQLAPALTAERAATHDLRGVELVDLSDAICDRRTCFGDRNGLEMFRDGEHLSVRGATSMTPRFAQLILAHARRR